MTPLNLFGLRVLLMVPSIALVGDVDLPREAAVEAETRRDAVPLKETGLPDSKLL